tara:strand:- start:71 stop:454 length:384 start_codon:yes stop_codon:yes gene_type:complete
MSINKIEKTIAQKPNIISSNSFSYLLIIFFNKIIKEITSKIFRTLGNEASVSVLKYKFTNKEKKKRVKIIKIFSFVKEKFLFINKSAQKIININRKVKFINKFPIIILIGNKQSRIINDFSKKVVLL